MDQHLTFTRTQFGARWRSSGFTGHDFLELCNGDFDAYVAVPDSVMKINVVISKEEPVGHDSFKIVPDYDPDKPGQVGLELSSMPSFYPGTRAELRKLHDNGYRYVRVEF